MVKKEHWITKWQREDNYGPAAGRPTCADCTYGVVGREAGADVLRCAVHKNCRVNRACSCAKAKPL